MQPAIFIARLAGPLFVVVGVGILLNGAVYSAMITEAVHSPTLIYFSGLSALLPGLAILNVHRTWTADWRVIITIFGWLLVIGGVIRIVLPQTTASLAGTIYSGAAALPVVAVISIVLGAFLSFQGYRPANK
jgi:glucan phosphoethanolaminetransferase (alkaline phosphatase superfamily)